MDILGDYLKLRNVKLVDRPKKKIVSTSIFLPENPSVNFKTPMYFVEMIKLVENFTEMMGDEYILRIYYDSIFDLGIKDKPLDSIIISDLEKSQQNTSNASTSLNSNALYTYQYNEISSKEGVDPKIKVNIKSNKDFLKKIIKMIFNYFNRVKRTRDPRYNNIELISYDCPQASKNPELLGHPATFGSIIRFLPIYDPSVDAFFCINSRYPITPLMKHIIQSWMDNLEKDLFAFSYDPPFMNHIIKMELYNKINNRYGGDDLKQFIPNKIEQYFVDTMNSIYDLKNKIFKSKKLVQFETSYEYAGITYDARFKNLRRRPGYMRYDENCSIAAGLFGIKKSCPYYDERGQIMAQYLQYLILSNNTFRFGIDELILKIILAFEVGAGGNNKQITSYFKHKKRTPYIELYTWDHETTRYIDNMNLLKSDATFLSTQPRTISIDKKKSRKNKPFRTSTKSRKKTITYQKTKKIQRQKVILKEISGVTIPNLFGENMLFNQDITSLKFMDSRSLYQKTNGQSLDKKDILVKKVYDTKYDMWVIFNSFSEEKKLVMVNNMIDKNIVTLFLTYYKMLDYYTVVDISTYKIGEINKLLDFLIDYYRRKENNNHNILNIVEPHIPNNGNNSEYSNSNSSEENKIKPIEEIGDLKQEYLYSLL